MTKYKYYVGTIVQRNISEYLPGEDTEKMIVGHTTDVSWHTQNRVRNKFTIKEIERYMPKWKKMYDAELPKGYRIILEPVLDCEREEVWKKNFH